MSAVLRNPPPAGARSGPEFYWKQIKRFGREGFTVNDLFARTRGVTRSTVKGYVQILRAAGAVVAMGTERADAPQSRTAVRYVVAAPGLLTPPSGKRGSHRDRMKGETQEHLWRVMRVLPSFTLEFLAVQASTADLEVNLNTTRTYVGKLVKAGLVVMTEPAAVVPGHRNGFTPASFRLLPSANSGPAPLRIVGDRVFDPNAARFVGAAIGTKSLSEVSA